MLPAHGTALEGNRDPAGGAGTQSHMMQEQIIPTLGDKHNHGVSRQKSTEVNEAGTACPSAKFILKIIA